MRVPINCYFIILAQVLLFSSCVEHGREIYLYDEMLWYNDTLEIGYFQRTFKSDYILDGRFSDFYFFAINDSRDTLFSEKPKAYTDFEIIDEMILFCDIKHDFGFKHGWFVVEDGMLKRIADFTESIPRDTGMIKYQNRNGLTYKWDVSSGEFDLLDPVFSYGDVLGVETKIFDPDCALYKYASDVNSLICITRKVEFDLTQDGTYYIPYPGMVRHMKVHASQFRERIIRNGLRSNEFSPPIGTKIRTSKHTNPQGD